MRFSYWLDMCLLGDLYVGFSTNLGGTLNSMRTNCFGWCLSRC